MSGLVAGELSESEAALRVYGAAAALALVGVLLLVLTVRWWRGTRPEPGALAPLEVMSERKWWKSPDPDRQRLLERHRPVSEGAADPIIAPLPVDLAALARIDPPSFDDLRDDRDLGEARVVGSLVVGGSIIPPEPAAVASDAADVDDADADADDAADETVADEPVPVVTEFDETVMAVRPAGVVGDDTDGVIQQALLIGDGALAEPGAAGE